MKKFFIATLAFVLLASITVTAFAAETELTDANKSEEIDVNVNYQDGTQTPTVYSVDVVWDSMTFTYNASGTKVWDATTHSYMDNTNGVWANDSADVTVTNHSNADVNVTVTYTEVGASGVNGVISNGDFSITSAVDKAVDDATLTKTATLTVSGVPVDKSANNLKIGTVTVVID